MKTEQLSELNIDQLKDIAKEHGISTFGNKSQLVKKIAAAFDKEEQIKDKKEEKEPVVENKVEVVAKPETKNKLYKVVPKNKTMVIVGGMGVPPEGTTVEEGSPLLRFSYYLDITEL